MAKINGKDYDLVCDTWVLDQYCKSIDEEFLFKALARTTKGKTANTLGTDSNKCWANLIFEMAKEGSEIAGKDFAYNILHTSFDPDKPPEVYIPEGQEDRWQLFSDTFGDWAWLDSAWQAEYGEDLPGIVIYANDALPIMIYGITAADSFDTDKVVAALENMEYVPTYFGMGTWMGKETWGQNHQIRRPITLYEIQGGEQILIQPPVLPAYYP